MNYICQMEQTSITIFGILVNEPMTALTDLLVSFVCFRSFIILQRKKEKPVYYNLYSAFLLVMGLATLYGGIIGHAFYYAFSIGWKEPGWIISMLSVGLAERAAIIHARPLMKTHIGDIISKANILEVIVMITVVIITENFFFVEAHAAYGLLLVVSSFELFVLLRAKDPGSKIMLYAVAASALAAIVHLSKFSLHKWFNDLDLSHVLMAVSSYLFFLGVQKTKFLEKDRVIGKV